jgi:hypothetical protein
VQLLGSGIALREAIAATDYVRAFADQILALSPATTPCWAATAAAHIRSTPGQRRTVEDSASPVS